MWLLLHRVARALVRILISARQPDRDDVAKDLEILVLRHQLRVLQRTSGPPRFRAIDRVLLSVASRALPWDGWASFVVIWSTEQRAAPTPSPCHSSVTTSTGGIGIQQN